MAIAGSVDPRRSARDISWNLPLHPADPFLITPFVQCHFNPTASKKTPIANQALSLSALIGVWFSASANVQGHKVYNAIYLRLNLFIGMCNNGSVCLHLWRRCDVD